jgi:hypothetical protein
MFIQNQNLDTNIGQDLLMVTYETQGCWHQHNAIDIRYATLQFRTPADWILLFHARCRGYPRRDCRSLATRCHCKTAYSQKQGEEARTRISPDGEFEVELEQTGSVSS